MRNYRGSFEILCAKRAEFMILIDRSAFNACNSIPNPNLAAESKLPEVLMYPSRSVRFKVYQCSVQ